MPAAGQPMSAAVPVPLAITVESTLVSSVARRVGSARVGGRLPSSSTFGACPVDRGNATRSIALAGWWTPPSAKLA